VISPRGVNSRFQLGVRERLEPRGIGVIRGALCWSNQDRCELPYAPHSSPWPTADHSTSTSFRPRRAVVSPARCLVCRPPVRNAS
jgi:hypothetical protein